MTKVKTSKLTNIGDNVFFFGCLLMAFLLPLHKIATTIPLVAIILGTLLGSKRSLRTIPTRYLWLMAISIGSYFVLVPGYFTSEYKIYALDDLRIKLPMLLLPLCFSIKKELSNKFLEKILLSYTLASIIISILIVLTASINLITTNKLLMHNDLLFYTIHHPTYLSVYLVFSFYWLYNYSFKTFFKKQKYLNTGIFSLYSVAIVLLSSKLGILLLFSLLCYLILRSFKGIKRTALITATLFSLAIIVWKVEFINERFQKMVNSFTLPDSAVQSYKIDDRVMIWKSSVKLIKESPWFGYGTGDYKDEHLRLEYDLNGFGKGYRMHYNAHNQFLENWLATGILGFLILIGFYIANLYFGIKQKNKTLLFFALLTLIFSMVESIQQSQSGNMFLFYFTCLFFNDSFLQKKKESTSLSS